MLTCRKKADRTIMANRIVSLCEELGATVTVRDDATHIWPDGSRPLPEYRNRLQVSIDLDGLAVAISLDGNASARSHCDEFHLAWHVAAHSRKHLSPLFGARVGGSVNEFHRRKCGAWAAGFDDLLNAISDGLTCALDGDAFLQPGEYPAPAGHTWDRAELERQGFSAVGAPSPCTIGFGALHEAAKRAGILAEDLTAFRLNDGSWQAFRRPMAEASA